jgi:hypothetical protein
MPDVESPLGKHGERLLDVVPVVGWHNELVHGLVRRGVCVLARPELSANALQERDEGMAVVLLRYAGFVFKMAAAVRCCANCTSVALKAKCSTM